MKFDFNYRDPTMMSCPNFGLSGSGIMRPYKEVSCFLNIKGRLQEIPRFDC